MIVNRNITSTKELHKYSLVIVRFIEARVETSNIRVVQFISKFENN